MGVNDQAIQRGNALPKPFKPMEVVLIESFAVTFLVKEMRFSCAGDQLGSQSKVDSSSSQLAYPLGKINVKIIYGHDRVKVKLR